MVSIVAYLCCTLHSAWHFIHVPTMRAALVTANVCRRRVAAAAAAASVPAPEATPEPVSGPESECFICLICLFPPNFLLLLLLLLLCRFFGCDTRFNSSCSACSTWQWICHKNCNDYVANVPYKSCWAQGSGVCVWQVWHGCICINVLCVLNVCVCVWVSGCVVLCGGA